MVGVRNGIWFCWKGLGGFVWKRRYFKLKIIKEVVEGRERYEGIEI